MNSAAIARRVASSYLAGIHKDAGLTDWVKWFVQPFKVIWKHHQKFVQGPVDDAVDIIIKELAPRLVRAIGEQEVQEDLEEFSTGATQGKFDYHAGFLADPPSGSTVDFEAGYTWGYENPEAFSQDLPPGIKRQVIEKAVRVYRKTITEEVIERLLKKIWDGVNPVHTFKAIVTAVKKHGWKLGVGFALFELFEHFALPALLTKLTGDPKMLALASLPIGEVVYAVVFRILGRTPKAVDTLTEQGHLDWYEQNFGAIRLATVDTFPSFPVWQNQYLVHKACLTNDAQNLPEIGGSVDRMVRHPGTVDVYFEDGSWVSANVDDPVLKTAQDEDEGMIDLIVAVQDQELLGAKDAASSGAKNGGNWLLDGFVSPFGLYHLVGVPLGIAEALVDFGTPAARIRDGKRAWQLARTYATSSTPFKKI